MCSIILIEFCGSVCINIENFALFAQLFSNMKNDDFENLRALEFCPRFFSYTLNK